MTRGVFPGDRELLLATGQSNRISNLLKGIARQFVDVMGLESALILVGWGQSNLGVVASEGSAADRILQDIYPRLKPRIRELGKSELTELRWESDLLLAVNMETPEGAIGLALIGPKHNGGTFVEAEKQLLATLAPLFSLTLYQTFLSNELRELIQQLIRVQERERACVAADIHDGPLQKAILLSTAGERPSANVDELRTELVDELREISAGLRPSILDDLGLIPAIEWMLERIADRSEMIANLSLHDVGEDERLDPETELALFRVCQEAINNIMKHADATHLDASLSRDGEMLVLTVSDDGVGFSSTPNQNGGIGLSGMTERMIYLGGSLEVSSAPGDGTTVIARVPIVKATSFDIRQ